MFSSKRPLGTETCAQAFAKNFGESADDLDMQVVYDVSHNVAKFEEHWVGLVFPLAIHESLRIAEICRSFTHWIVCCPFKCLLCHILHTGPYHRIF